MTWLLRRNHVGTGQSSRQFSNAFKERIVLRLEAGERIAAVADETGSGASCFTNGATPTGRWGWPASTASAGRSRDGRKGEPSEGRAASAPAASPDAAASAARPSDELKKAEARIAELERVIGRQQADLHFFREALRLWDATTPNGGAPISTRSSKK